MMPETVSVDPVTLRPIEAGDAEAVSQLTGQLGYERSAKETAEWIEALESRPDQAVFVACIGTTVVGWVEISIQYHIQSEPYALIGGLVVKEGHRGMRIGQRLCAQAEAWSWARGLDAVRVTSRSTRADAHRFYLREGYSEMKTSHVFEKRRKE